LTLFNPFFCLTEIESRRGLFETQGGVVVSNLISTLEKNNLGLLTLAGSPNLSIAGYISTATHGTGHMLLFLFKISYAQFVTNET